MKAAGEGWDICTHTQLIISVSFYRKQWPANVVNLDNEECSIQAQVSKSNGSFNTHFNAYLLSQFLLCY